jgi:class 3 adenylate cyclase
VPIIKSAGVLHFVSELKGMGSYIEIAGLSGKLLFGLVKPNNPGRRTAMQEVADWLEKLGLGQYAQRFAENDISFSVLSDLTDQDLKEIGVSLGHRRQMLRAIANLDKPAVAPVPPMSVAPIAATLGPSAAAEASAERRQVTVMFSDLVGSTALSARMDPEDLREVISAYQKCVAETVQRFGGFVAKYMGDGVLVYFGYPQAHEDNAERAVRAGLELIAAVSVLKTRASLQTRLGIATGLVVVGEIIGIGTAQERAIVGETPNLAARLQTLAAPDAIMIGEATQKLLGGSRSHRRTRTKRICPTNPSLARARRGHSRESFRRDQGGSQTAAYRARA